MVEQFFFAQFLTVFKIFDALCWETTTHLLPVTIKNNCIKSKKKFGMPVKTRPSSGMIFLVMKASRILSIPFAKSWRKAK